MVHIRRTAWCTYGICLGLAAGLGIRNWPALVGALSTKGQPVNLLRLAVIETIEAYVKQEISRALKFAGHSKDQVERYLREREEWRAQDRDD